MPKNENQQKVHERYKIVLTKYFENTNMYLQDTLTWKETENSSGVELNICTSLDKSEKEHIMEIMEKDVRKENIIDIASELAGMEPIHKARITGYIEGVNEERRRWQERTMVVRRK
jgi:hypothetical protein